MRSLPLTSWLMLALSLPAGAIAEEPGFRFYEGTINERLAFRMVLPEPPNAGLPCEGSYVYNGKRQAIPLFGKCSAALLNLSEEPQVSGRSMGTARNRIKADAVGGGFTGVWQSADGKKSFSFEAHQVRPDRRAMLVSAIGTYHLAGIGGFFGANTMSDIWRQGKGWKANISGISGGMREGSFVQLTAENIKLLNSLELRVDPDLNIEIQGRGRRLALFSYSERPSFRVTRISRQDGVDRIFERDAPTSFLRGELRIATTDAIDAMPLVDFENMSLDTSTPVVAGLDYDPKRLRFYLQLLSANCCDSVVLSFEPRH